MGEKIRIIGQVKKDLKNPSVNQPESRRKSERLICKGMLASDTVEEAEPALKRSKSDPEEVLVVSVSPRRASRRKSTSQQVVCRNGEDKFIGVMEKKGGREGKAGVAEDIDPKFADHQSLLSRREEVVSIGNSCCRPLNQRRKKAETISSIRREDTGGEVTRRAWDPTDSSHVQAVKKALHLSEVPDTILCRDLEQTSVIDFCKACVTEQRAGSVYVCGCPGTGKSLTVEKVKLLCPGWSKQAGTLPPQVVTINCTSLTDPRSINWRVLQALKPKHVYDESSDKDLVVKELKKLVCESSASRNSRKMLLLIVDEMDYLITRDQSVLYELFRLPALPDSRVILIGIANAIDLTDRLLPKLRSMNCKVDAITFPTYTKDQILAVIQQRLKGLPFSVFQPAALELCARKVAAATGDMRKALHVCRSAVELVEAKAAAETSEEKLGAHVGFSSNGGAHQSSVVCSDTNGKQVSEKEPALIQIDAMARVLSRTFRSPVVETIHSLPRHQQMVLCAAVSNFRRGKKDANVGELNKAYLEFCKSTGMQPLTPPEFSSVCQVLADQALLKVGSSREDRMRRVTLTVDEEDVVFSLQGIRFFKTCL